MSEDVDTGEAPVGSQGAATRAKHSSVVYVHGMGNQRRYEETSRLIDRLDRYLVSQHQSGNSVGRLSNIKARVEPLRGATSSSDIVGYIRTVFSTGRKMENARSVRFYEVYWAPVMAEQKSPWRVLKWLLSQPLRPWRTLRAPWRERQRLRRAALVQLCERAGSTPRGAEQRDFGHLVRLYHDFEGLGAQRRFPAGTFDEFLTFIDEEYAKRPETAARCRSLAGEWRAAYRKRELRNAFFLATMTLALLLLSGGVLVGLLAVLQSLLTVEPISDIIQQWDIPLKADWKTATAIAVSLAGILGLGAFLTNYLGDVEAWATYEETDVKHMARNKVLNDGMALLTHVLGDPDCERVTVVAHSLGTSVAHDTLLALTRRNRAHRIEDPMGGLVQLQKIEHFITMGSPIDKIEYFFESYTSASHRYKRVVEAFRGDIGTEPFSRNRKPHIHWINFWDQGDPISGALHSPASSSGLAQRVDNVHVASFRFPAPGSSHSGYFENATVIRGLFEAIYNRSGSFHTLDRPGPDMPYDYESVFSGPGEPLGARLGYLGIAVAAPWLVLIGLFGWLIGQQFLAYGAAGLLFLSILIMLFGYSSSKIRGPQHPV